MARPTPDEIAAAKAECRRRFGHERVIGIPLGEPIDLYVIMAAFSGMRDAGVYVDARCASAIQARSALIVDRCLWPEQAVLAAVRERRGHLDAKIEEHYRTALGWSGDDAHASVQRFSTATAPPGFASPSDLATKCAELQAAHPAAELWSITNRPNGLALVVAGPGEEVSTAYLAAMADVQKNRRGVLAFSLGFIGDLIVWSPKPLAAYFDESPGRAEDLAGPMLEMGGATASGSASFL